jgi:sensor histidine kinase regulating citrate/malate metabolism
MTLRSKLTGLVALNTVVVLVLVLLVCAYLIRAAAYEETGQRALAVARAVAASPDVVRAFREPNPSATIQPVAASIREATQAKFIVVANMDLIRYSHPNPAAIGKHMVGEDNQLVLAGLESITRAHGTLGPSVRGKAPVFDEEHRQIGVVSTGFLVLGIDHRVRRMIVNVTAAGVVALLLGLLGAYLLSGHFKRQILGMEPLEIAFATQQQSAILEAIREGVVAIDAKRRIVHCNREAKKILGAENTELVAKELSAVLPASRLTDVLETGEPQHDQPMVVGHSLVVTNGIPVLLDGKVIGAVCTFRDKLHLEAIESRLADIGRYVDELRSQRHEFMNKLHLISGRIQLSDYEGARAVIEQVNDEHQRAVHFYMARIRDPAVMGILVGKTHRAEELGVRLRVTDDSFVSETCPHRDPVVTIIGNAVENAFEAHQSVPVKAAPPEVTVSLREEPENLLIEVKDNGPGIDPSVRDRLFEAGATTKGAGRGLGLAIVARLVATAGGFVACQSDGRGTSLRIELPRAGA